MIYIYSFNTDNNDYEAYYDLYTNIRPGKMEYITSDAESSPFFSYSMMAIKYLGVNYNMYRMLILLIFWGAFGYFFRNMIEWGILVAGYGIVVFFFDLVQVRFAFSEYLLFIALYFLVQGHRWVYCIIVFIAALFHSMILPYLVFAFLPLHEHIICRVSKTAPYIVLTILMASIVGRSVIENLQTIISMIPIFDEYSNKMEQTVSMGYLLYLIYQTANLFVAHFCFHKNSLIDVRHYSFHKKFNQFNYMIQIVGLLFVIPAMLNINFGRFIRIMLIINLINISLFFFAIRAILFTCRTRMRLLLMGYYVSLGVLWIIGESFINGTYPYILESVFGSF